MNRFNNAPRVVDLRKSTAAGVFLAGFTLVASGCTGSADKPQGLPTHVPSSAPTQQSNFTPNKDCQPFNVYAQNRWTPYGTAVREAPSATSKQVGGFGGTQDTRNQTITVDGFIHSGDQTYKDNVAPFNNDVWYHLKFALKAGQDEWVSFPGVRGAPTSEDPSGQSLDGGRPAPLDPNCLGTYEAHGLHHSILTPSTPNNTQ